MTRKGVQTMLAIFESALRVKFAAKDVGVWQAVLRDITDEEGAEAAYRLCRTKAEYPPKTADVVRAVDELRERRRVPPLALPSPQESVDPEGVEQAKAIIREALERVKSI